MFQKVNAQSDISNLFRSGGDLNQVAKGYVKPLGIGFATGMGGSWYNTAATHHTLGFDITLKAGAIFVPTSDKTFDLTGLKNLKVTNGEKNAPSFAGSGNGVGLSLTLPDSTYNYNGTKKTIKGQKILDMQTPVGVASVIPAVCIQGSVGLPFKTELTVRYLPQTQIKNVNCNLWGVAIKHDFKQWIPVFNKLPFSLSVMLAYTKFDMDYAFTNKITPAKLVTDSATTPIIYDQLASKVDYYNNNKQGFGLSSSSFMANVIISKDLLFFTPYLGLGFSQNNFHFGFNGHYPILNGIDAQSTVNSGKVSYDVTDLNNPVQLDYNTFMPSATVGFKVKLLLLALSAQYTFQQYPSASVGVGLGFR